MWVALLCRHPCHYGPGLPVPFRASWLAGIGVELPDDAFCHVPGIKHQGAYPDAEALRDVLHDAGNGAQVKHVARDSLEPYREPGLLVQHQHEPRLD